MASAAANDCQFKIDCLHQFVQLSIVNLILFQHRLTETGQGGKKMKLVELTNLLRPVHNMFAARLNH